MTVSRAMKVVLVAGAVVLLGSAGVVWLGWNASARTSGRTTTDSIADVLQGQTIEHEFVLTNDGPDDLVIKDAVPWASTIVSVDSVIRPGGTGRVRIRLETKGWTGSLSELIKVHFVDSGRLPIWLQLRGRVILPVQIEPHDRVYFFTVRGDDAQKSVDIVNHQDHPLAILDVQSSNPAFRAESRTVRAGEQYRITITLDPAAAVGEHRATVTVRTDNRRYPTLAVQALAKVSDLVHTSISEINFSTFAFEALNLEAVHQRSVLVEKHRASDFEVLRATTDLPFLKVEVRPQQRGRSYLVVIRIMRDRVQRGMKFQGTLVIETNDPVFPRLELPIKGAVA